MCSNDRKLILSGRYKETLWLGAGRSVQCSDMDYQIRWLSAAQFDFASLLNLTMTLNALTTM